MDETQKQLQKLTQRRHPEYADRLDHWRFVEQSYEGGREWFKDNIFRYYKEGDVEFSDRLDRAYRFNHTREVVDLIDKYIFKMQVTRAADAPEAIKRFWKTATLNGLNITDYVKKISRLSSIFGRVWVVVDSKKAEGEVQTLADERATSAPIYSYVLRPEAVCDLSVSDDGEYNWVLIHEQVRDDADPLTSSGAMIDRYRLWTRDDYTVYTVTPNDGSEAAQQSAALAPEEIARRVRAGETGNIAPVASPNTQQQFTIEIDGPHPHEFGSVPVFPADNVISDEQYSSRGMVDDIAYMDRAVANYLSNLDAIIQDQTFSQLVIPAQGVSSDGDESVAKKGLVEMGTKRIFSYDSEAGTAPQYISPDVKQAELILSAITKIIAEIYHTAGLSGERTKDDNSQGIDNSSGVAKAYDFERVNSMLAAKADSLELVEHRLMMFVARWAGIEAEVDSERRLVSYPDNFDVRGLYDEFEMAARLSLIEAPALVRQIQMMQLVDKMFPQLEKDKRDKIERQVEEWAEPVEEDPVTGASNTGRDGARASKNRTETFKDAKNSLANKLVKETG